VGGSPAEVFIPEDHDNTGKTGADTHWSKCETGNARGETVDA